jgi:hypothetical protein
VQRIGELAVSSENSELRDIDAADGLLMAGAQAQLEAQRSKDPLPLLIAAGVSYRIAIDKFGELLATTPENPELLLKEAASFAGLADSEAATNRSNVRHVEALRLNALRYVSDASKAAADLSMSTSVSVNASIAAINADIIASKDPKESDAILAAAEEEAPPWLRKFLERKRCSHLKYPASEIVWMAFKF